MSSQLVDEKRGPRFWWSQLCAVPPAPRGLAYERLKRVWFDQTGFRSWFRNAATESHLVCTLFENMTLFDAKDWVPELFEQAGMHAPTQVSSCRWSYEFEDELNLKRGKATIADVVGCATDPGGEFVFVIEAKRGRGGLKAGDNDPDYYLASPTLRRYARRYMLYLLDEADLAVTRPPAGNAPDCWGILTWQKLGGLQINLARRLEGAPQRVRDFVAGAIQYQFCQHGIRPHPLAFPYLKSEPEYDAMPVGQNEPGAQQTPERREPMWRCDWQS